MNKLRLAIVGFGKLGRMCAEAIFMDDRLDLVGIVRRPESADFPFPKHFTHLPTVSHISELKQVDGALISVPTSVAQGVARELLQQRIPIVECASFYDEAFVEHKHELDRIASHHRVAAIVGAGWDPGMLSLFRGLFALMTPRGHSETTRRPGASLHHTCIADTVPGVKAALATELRTANGTIQRYVYVELKDGAEYNKVNAAICNDPLFVGEETLVLAVDNIATLEEEGQGVLLERHGSAVGMGHQSFLLEGRYSELAITAEIMLAAARALPACRPGAYSIEDLPLSCFTRNMQVH